MTAPTRTAVISTDEPLWKQKLQAMAAYYTKCSKEGDLAKFRRAYPITPPTQRSDLPDDAVVELKDTQKENIDEHEAATDSVQEFTAEMQSEVEQDPEHVDKAAWRLKMDEQRQSLLQQSADIINAKFDKAIGIIDKLPAELQEPAADFWGTLAAGFLQFWSEVWDKILTVVQAVIDWLASIWENIKQAFQAVANFFVDAYNWLASIFP